MNNQIFNNSRHNKKRRLLLFTFLLIVIEWVPSYAHQSPNSLIFLDVSPDKVAMEVQLPLSELELAFGNDIAKSPETIIEKYGSQLNEYISTHTHIYINKNKPWLVQVKFLRLSKGKYIESGNDYWELIADIEVRPEPGENTRSFLLDYDVIMHQVVNHVALVAIRNDWENGKDADNTGQAMAISRNTGNNIIYPLEINLEKGSCWKGFKSMFKLGMRHIKEGTDHLLFLIVLLLPAMLLVNGRRWGKFGGTKYSIVRVLKITTAFTIGHSITLLVGALGLVKLPTQPIEILIAISILVSAIHAITPIFAGRETYVTAGFGLIHGLAFASILSNLKLGTGTLAVSIVGFNVGIELMQLCIIALIVPWLMLLSHTSLYSYIRIGGAVLAGIAAIGWIVERGTGKLNSITAAIQKIMGYTIWFIFVLAITAAIVFLLRKKNTAIR
jgi:HupE / UreJ protein